MANKHISASGSDITPKQVDMETAKSMLKKFDEYIDRNERNFKNAMAYQEQPITVVASEDINNWIKDRATEYEEYRKNLSDVHGDIDALRRMTCSYGDTAKDVKDTLKLNVELLTFFKQKLEAPAPEPKGFEKFDARFKVWWNTRKVFWWRVGISTFIVLGSALASVLVCLYTTDGATMHGRAGPMTLSCCSEKEILLNSIARLASPSMSLDARRLRKEF